MSLMRMAAVAQQGGLSCGQFSVLMILADCENDRTGVCNPSYETIGSRIGIKKRQVGTIVRSLVSLGKITCRRTGSSIRFGFCFDKVSRTTVSSQDVARENAAGSCSYGPCPVQSVGHDSMPESAVPSGRKLPVSEWQKTADKPGSIINQEDNLNIQEQDKQENINKTCSCSRYVKQDSPNCVQAQRARQVVAEPVRKREQERDSSASQIFLKRVDDSWDCIDMTREEFDELNSWTVFHTLSRRYNVFRLNHRIVSAKLDEIRRNGFRSGNGQKIRYMWTYLAEFAKRIRNDKKDVDEYWRNMEIRRKIAEYERMYPHAYDDDDNDGVAICEGV